MPRKNGFKKFKNANKRGQKVTEPVRQGYSIHDIIEAKQYDTLKMLLDMYKELDKEVK